MFYVTNPPVVGYVFEVMFCFFELKSEGFVLVSTESTICFGQDLRNTSSSESDREKCFIGKHLEDGNDNKR